MNSPSGGLEDRVRHWQDRFKQMMPNRGPPGPVVLAVIALVGVGVWTAYYTVPSDSVAVVQRFGKYYEEVPPGLHFKLPLGIDAATIVPVKRQLKQEFGSSPVFSALARRTQCSVPSGRYSRQRDP